MGVRLIEDLVPSRVGVEMEVERRATALLDAVDTEACEAVSPESEVIVVALSARQA